MNNKPRSRRQRSHQTNELNFLAWMRTAITLIGFGFAIARFGIFLSNLQLSVTRQQEPPESAVISQNLGVGLVGIGILTIALAAWRYNRIFWQIERDDYQPSRWFALFTAAIVILLGGLSIPFVLLRNPALPSHQIREKDVGGDRSSEGQD